MNDSPLLLTQKRYSLNGSERREGEGSELVDRGRERGNKERRIKRSEVLFLSPSLSLSSSLVSLAKMRTNYTKFHEGHTFQIQRSVRTRIEHTYGHDSSSLVSQRRILWTLGKNVKRVQESAVGFE